MSFEPTLPNLVREAPILISVSRINPIKNIKILNIPTITGDWSWKPHPTKTPLCLRNKNAKAIVISESATPEQKDDECFLISSLDSPPVAAKLNTLSGIIGYTQGIKFKSKPPINANNKAWKTESELTVPLL